ncbi:MAG: hypothetical protein ACLR0U_02400 [Enterocloster clostridioformis]
MIQWQNPRRYSISMKRIGNGLPGDTGADKEMLKTWEGLAQAAGMYYEWSGGSPFLGMNAFNDFASLTAAQLGEGIRWTQDGSNSIIPGTRPGGYGMRIMRPLPIRGWYEAGPIIRTALKAGG